MDLRLNATRRSTNLSVYLVSDLEAGQLKFLSENLLGAGRSKLNELSILDSFLQCAVRVNTKPTKSHKFTIL